MNKYKQTSSLKLALCLKEIFKYCPPLDTYISLQFSFLRVSLLNIPILAI